MIIKNLSIKIVYFRRIFRVIIIFMKRVNYFLSIVLLLSGLIFIGCSKKNSEVYYGYAEGDFVNVGSTQSGRLLHLHVHRGEYIKKGTLLFELDPEFEKYQFAETNNQTLSAKSTYNDYTKGLRTEEINILKSQLAQASANAENAQVQYERNKALYPSNSISMAQLDDSKTLYETTRNKVAEILHNIDVAKMAKREDQIKAQRFNVAAIDQQNLQSAWKLHEKKVYAQSDAFVFNTVYREGEVVNSGGIIVRLLPPENLKVRFFVPQSVVEGLHVGDIAYVQARSDGKKILVKIRYISPEAEFTPPVIYSNETKSKLTYMVEAYPERNLASLFHVGQPLEVFLKHE